jgi:hypothetical protein
MKCYQDVFHLGDRNYEVVWRFSSKYPTALRSHITAAQSLRRICSDVLIRGLRVELDVYVMETSNLECILTQVVSK